jgi:hypothetical protein
MNTLAASIRAQNPPQVLERASLLLESGFEKLVLEDPLHASSWEELRKFLPRESVAAIRLFLPYPRAVRVGESNPFRLGALGGEERRDAMAQAAVSLQTAADHSIPLVLLPVVRGEIPTREGPAGSDPARSRTLDAYKSALSRILDLADRAELTICITPSARPEELPAAPDTEECFREFAGAPLAIWLDVARFPADLRDFRDQAPRQDGGTQSPGPPARLRGVSIHDLRSQEEGHVPGSGETDWQGLRDAIRRCPLWVLDLRARASAAEIRQGYEFLEEYRGAGADEGTFVGPLGF